MLTRMLFPPPYDEKAFIRGNSGGIFALVVARGYLERPLVFLLIKRKEFSWSVPSGFGLLRLRIQVKTKWGGERAGCGVRTLEPILLCIPKTTVRKTTRWRASTKQHRPTNNNITPRSYTTINITGGHSKYQVGPMV